MTDPEQREEPEVFAEQLAIGMFEYLQSEHSAVGTDPQNMLHLQIGHQYERRLDDRVFTLIREIALVDGVVLDSVDTSSRPHNPVTYKKTDVHKDSYDHVGDLPGSVEYKFPIEERRLIGTIKRSVKPGHNDQLIVDYDVSIQDPLKGPDHREYFPWLE